jgi:RNA ligase (TIGR02306 family)
MQNLASVEKVVKIDPIDGADFIQKATVLGWELVIKKGEFAVGDLAGYIQIDTVVPETEQFEFLRERKFRVRTIKLRKQISQGVLVPLPPGDWKEGDDITEALGVKKYSKDVEMVEDRPAVPKVWYKRIWYRIKYRYLVKIFPGLKTFNRASFPTKLVPITDEERIQNMPQVLTQYAGKRFIVSEKLDGSSITIIHEKKGFRKAKFRICSRRFELFNTKNEWHGVFISTGFADHIANLVKEFDTNNIIVQGEYVGKPQGNKYQLSANEIRLFNIYVCGKRLKQDEFYDVCEKYSIPSCPRLQLVVMSYTLPEIIQYAEGKSLLNKNTEREGVVFRCIDADLSFKVISNKYLLKNDE